MIRPDDEDEEKGRKLRTLDDDGVRVDDVDESIMVGESWSDRRKSREAGLLLADDVTLLSYCRAIMTFCEQLNITSRQLLLSILNESRSRERARSKHRTKARTRKEQVKTVDRRSQLRKLNMLFRNMWRVERVISSRATTRAVRNELKQIRNHLSRTNTYIKVAAISCGLSFAAHNRVLKSDPQRVGLNRATARVASTAARSRRDVAAASAAPARIAANKQEYQLQTHKSPLRPPSLRRIDGSAASADALRGLVRALIKFMLQLQSSVGIQLVIVNRDNPAVRPTKGHVAPRPVVDNIRKKPGADAGRGSDIGAHRA